MASRALMWSRLVKQDGIVIHLASQLVTVPAWNIHVAPFQGEIRAGLMVKQRRLPARRVMATFAPGIQSVSGELMPVGILVTTVTFLGSRVVDHVLHGDFQIRWFMAIDARHRPVSASEDKRSGRVIEAQLLRPGGSGVAGLTAPHRSIGAPRFHSLREFTTVRVNVAGCA